MSENRQNGDVITPLRGASMGFVSGAKGGFAAGALGGGVGMVIEMADAPLSIVIFTLIVGLTFGGMAGGVFGGIQGATAGAFSGRQRQNNRPYGWFWWVTAVALGLLFGWLLGDGRIGAVLFGGVCGVLSGFIS